MAYIAGEDIKTSIKFEVDELLTDPTAFSVHVKPPNAAKLELVFGVDAELTQLGTGDFLWTQSTTYEATNADVGRWEYVVVSLGVAKGAKKGFFVVDRPPVAA